MRRDWLASAAIAAVAISVPVTALGGTAQAAPLIGQRQTVAGTAHARVLKNAQGVPVTWNMAAAALGRRLVGDPYVYGGTGPVGFDCSGLAQWVYRHAGHGKWIDRTADQQFFEFRRISQAAARPGDLVFFHVTSDPDSLVYHVGVYEGGDDMVAAATSAQGVVFQSFTWAGDTVTFGTITH